MVNFHIPFTKPRQREAITADHGPGLFQKEAAGKGQTYNKIGGYAYNEKLEHPNNMGRYPKWSCDPQVRVAIDLKVDMIAGSGYYVQMPEKDRNGKAIAADHPNLAKIEQYLKDIDFRDKYKQIQRQKFEMGFCAVEVLSDRSLKILPSDSIYIWRKATGETYKVTQEYNKQEVAKWEAGEIGTKIIFFIHNEDPLHPYGHAVTDSIGGLIDGMVQLNVDMPKIIHRYSSPLGVWESSRDITPIKTAVTQRDVYEDIFIGNVEEKEVRHDFVEPQTQTKFMEYIDQMNFQIGQALHAPLILLLKNATEASATKMLESVDRANTGEQQQNADIIEQKLFLPICGEPVPEFLHGATDQELNEVTLDQIGTLKGNSTITWKQAQDLIRKKGIALIEDVEPKPEPILNNKNPNDPGKPLMNKDKLAQTEMRLQTVKAAFENKMLLLSEALKEGDTIIRQTVFAARKEAETHTKETLGISLSTDADHHFDLIRQTLFSQFKQSLLPVAT
jgi:hypothetical protein